MSIVAGMAVLEGDFGGSVSGVSILMLLWSNAGQGVCDGEGLKALGVGTDGSCTVEHDTEISAINDKSIQITFFKQICLLSIII